MFLLLESFMTVKLGFINIIKKCIRFIHKWCGTPVSNRRPSAWQADALPTELVPH